MKKFTLLIALMLFAVTSNYAQVSSYTFAQSNEVYTPITGGTVITTSTDGSPNLDSYASSEQTLPAAIEFSGTSYTSFRVSSNGHLSLGSTSTSAYTTTPITSSTGSNAIMALVAADLEEGANGVADIRFDMVGDEVVVQWTNFRRYARTESFNFQVRLNTVSGVIRYVYDGTPPYDTDTSAQPQVGIKSAVGEYIALTVAAGESWNTPVVLTTGATSTSKASLKGDDGFTSGLTYTFTPPPACTGIPVAGTIDGDEVRNICNGSTPSSITVIDATAAPGITRQWEQSLNGTDWVDAVDGSGATTLSYTPPTFEGTPIQYRLKITCTNSSEIVYSPVVTINNPAAPATQVADATVAAEDNFATSFEVNWTNGTGNRRLVIVSDAAITDPTDGSGDAIEDNNIYSGSGQQIVYDGTGTSVTVYGLPCGADYFVKVYEYTRCGSAPYDYYYNTTNGTNAITVTPAAVTTAALPVSNDFTGFTGSNLSEVMPGWVESKITTAGGDTPSNSYPGGNSSVWTNSSVLGETTAKINLYTDTRNDWIISPKMELTAESRFVFKAAITNFASGTADANGMQGTDDLVKVMVSTDGCGAIWTPIYTFNAANTVDLTNTLVDYEVLLSDYTGQIIQIAFQAIDGPSDDSPDYDFHIGSLLIEEVPACDVPVLADTTTITKNSATINWVAPSTGTPVGYEYVVSTTDVTPTTAGASSTALTADVTILDSSTDYFVFVRTNCGGAFSAWTVAGTFTTLCDYPEILTTTPATICGQGEANLTATSDGGTINWYANAVGGASIATGATLTTEEITETTTYYVSAQSDGGAPIGGGILAPEASWTGTALNNWGIIFTALDNVTLNSVDVYSTSEGTLDVKIVDASNNELYATGDVNVAAGGTTTPTTIPLNFDVTSGEVYKIVIKSFSGVSLVRGSSNLEFPYNNGNINVTSSEWGGTTTGTYYFFYNIQSTGACASPRTAVVATVTDAPEITVSDDVAICPEESTEISVTSDNADYTYVWTPGDLAGATQSVSPEETTTYTVVATDAITGCVTEGEVTVTVNPLPSAVEAEDLSACLGAIEVLEATGGNLGGEGTVGDGTEVTSTTEEFTPFCNRRNTHKSQSIYTVADLTAAGIGPGNIVSIAYNITSIGSAATNDDFIVKMGTTTLDVFPDNSYLDESSFVTVLDPVTYTHAEGINTITFTTPFEWDGVSNVVISISQSGADSLYNAQTYFTDLDANTAIYNYNNLDATTGTVTTKRFNVTFNVVGSTEITWTPATNLYTDADATVPYTEGTDARMVYFKSDSETAITYTVTATSDNDCSVSNTVDVTTTTTAAPVIDDNNFTVCNAGTIADLEIEGENIQWYANETGGEPLADDTVLADGFYYASQTIDGCESATRTGITMTINVVDAPAVDIVDIEACTGIMLSNVAITGDNIQWYAAEEGGDVLASETILVDGTTYYASQTIEGCESATRTAINAIIATTDAPTVDNTDVTICNAGTVADLVATGDNIQWYTAEVDGDALATDVTLATGSYYVSQTIDGCESTRTLVNVTVNVTGAPTVDAVDVTICNAGTIADLVATGDNIQWYAAEVDGDALATDVVLVTGTSYYASQTVEGCESVTRTGVNVTVTTTDAPTIDNTDVTICNAGTIADLEIEGENIQWYAAEVDGDALVADVALVTGTTYYASQTVEGCESATRTAVTVTINEVAALTGDAAQTIEVEASDVATIEDIVVNAEDGAIIAWYLTEADALSGDNRIDADTELVDGTTYYGTQIIGECESNTVLAVTMSVVLDRDNFDINAFSFYPNPVKDILNISYNAEINSVAVFNLLGQQVLAQQPNTNEVQLDMSTLSDGTYLINLTAGNTVKTIKVVKN
ncbi:MAG: hypothetical protein BM557_00005 [Flavobacterium sp. MedPE-SWcel]|uniref:Ig-like domain-containing protein n=1 Tax=uncultured Flavobacterium sp. TaxID=165435 RepID=UPI00092212D1|nr:T9SS type A sorting domain-containing protein [uncultured Flavobacterium sp.]OIQ22408.1 MAG: hypothetical protein BM557_00005 [Flavobacterium sp. MedPE-SWcel]